MNKSRNELIEHLIYKYEFQQEYLNSLNDEQLLSLYNQKENESLILAKNPNKFFYIKSLPIPKDVKPKTSAKAGKWIFIAFIVMILLLFTLFMIVAFINNR
ncbi:hypothetical protein BCF59_0526 [Mycoplasmopsis mustelae]|uniref:Uncharacterized protein n=1 Tax=Mycoplasmopsis mustelae TaxID=171289 RepID=A0A4R7UD95_9BACT|nr:hypothetical protein [Mycoplasmopsis mustelae]TDV23535.1 hypothetical protein BCF59_0526 [Mycoplasmopsis mustelae]